MSRQKLGWSLKFGLLTLLLVACDRVSETLFERLDRSDTNIDFANNITETDYFNILTYEYIYNGGGVGVADFNNDGLSDIVFTGNQVANALYLNEGDMEFKNVTEASGIASPDKWCTGVAIVDLNADGWKDIYICSTTLDTEQKRANLFFEHQGLDDDGNPVFEEKAAEYGIAEGGHSMNAAFFDYDQDGDLDLYVLNNQLGRASPAKFRRKQNNGKYLGADQFYRNDSKNGQTFFTNVTIETGIVYEGYGLGINVTDLNQDGWPDVYISNDYITNNVLYINQQDGTFKNEVASYLKHQANSAMGNDVVDINNDGLSDIFELDMMPKSAERQKQVLHPSGYNDYLNTERFGYEYQYDRNMLQLNNGQLGDSTLAFSEVGMLTNMHATDWSWSPLIADFDNNGYKDIVVTNGFFKDVSDKDFADFRNSRSLIYSRKEILEALPTRILHSIGYANYGNLEFKEETLDWGLETPSYTNGAAYADLDNDGDVDMVMNNLNNQATVYENFTSQKHPGRHYLKVKLDGVGQNIEALGAKLTAFASDGELLAKEHFNTRGYLSSQDPVIHFGLGSKKIDSLMVEWPNGGVSVIQNPAYDTLLTLKQTASLDVTSKQKQIDTSYFKEVSAEKNLNFIHQEPDFIDFNVQRLLPHKFTQSGPGIAVADLNSDGNEDLLVSGSGGELSEIIWSLGESFDDQTTKLPAGLDQETLGTVIADFNGDGLNDIYSVSGGYSRPLSAASHHDRVYLNKGNKRFKLLENALPEFIVSGSCVKAQDFDNDGDLDLFVGGRVSPANYPKAVDSYLLENVSTAGEIKFQFHESNSLFKALGLVTDALWTDIDNDQDFDLVVVGEWMGVEIFENNDGVLSRLDESQNAMRKLTGWWNSIQGGDLDNDGDTDYVLGNLGLNSIYKASAVEPVTALAADFDQNSGYDVVLGSYLESEDGTNKLFPTCFRADLISQMPVMKKRFLKHEEYASKTLEELFEAEELAMALRLEAVELESLILVNDGAGNLEVKYLPRAAQVAPVYGIQLLDVNEDTYLDIILTGNGFDTEVNIGRYDAFNGLVLVSGQSSFSYRPLTIAESGFYVPGDAKALARVKMNGKHHLVASQNRGKLLLFEAPSLEIELPTYRKIEKYYGSSYLSQSGN